MEPAVLPVAGTFGFPGESTVVQGHTMLMPLLVTCPGQPVQFESIDFVRDLMS